MAVLATTSLQAGAEVPSPNLTILARGINITHWFRFVPQRNAAALSRGIDQSGLQVLKRAGFTYVRLPIGPEEMMVGQHIAPDMLRAIVSAVGRIEKAGLGVMVEPHPQAIQNWDLQHNAQARAKLIGFWHDLAPALRQFPAGMTFPELVNEPSVKDPSAWDGLQQELASQVRKDLPSDTIVLTGTDWSSIDGLLKVKPVADTNVVYSFHTYEPQVLTLLAFWDPAANKKQLAENLPFPAADPVACNHAISAIRDKHTADIGRYWCSLHQDEAAVSRNLSRAVDWGHAHGVAVAMTEFGAVSQLNAKARLGYLRAVRDAAETLKLPWALWGLDDQMGFNQPFSATLSRDQLPQGTMQALGILHNRGL